MPMKRRVLATGASGMVGSYLSCAYGPDELVCTDIDKMDVRSYAQVELAIRTVRPDLVLHLAAETDVDLCEKDPDHAFRTNTIGTHNVALACQRHEVEMVYVSTLGIFDGLKNGPYTEFDCPDPQNVYARSKWEGERIVQSLLRRYYICRAGWMFGGGEARDKKFVGKIIALSAERSEIQAVDDKIGSPTYARDLVQHLCEIARSGHYGLYHVANAGVCSRAAFAGELIRLLERGTTVKPVPSSYFPLPAPRPRSEAGRAWRLELMGLRTPRPWQEALRGYLLEWPSLNPGRSGQVAAS
jgi:dTDP-4-dehydrorhamnose reductase